MSKLEKEIFLLLLIIILSIFNIKQTYTLDKVPSRDSLYFFAETIFINGYQFGIRRYITEEEYKSIHKFFEEIKEARNEKKT